MKKIIALAALLSVSSFAVAQGFQDPNASQANAEPPYHSMKKDRKGHKAHAQGFFDEHNAIKSVSALKNAQDNDFLMIEGKIIKQVGKKTFLFQDATGETEIEVRRQAWNGQIITPNDTVIIRGKVDKEWNKTEIEVKQVMKK